MTWATQRLDEIVRGEGAIPPVVSTLQLGLLDSWQRGRVFKTWHASPDVLQLDGAMFGGYIAALADQMAAFAAMTVVPGDQAFRTTNLSVQFFKVVRNPTLLVEGRVLSQSKSLITVDVEFRVGEALIARASATQFLTLIDAR
ncbi:MAG: PaaI family thioesterase [Micropepsaceae bacterium]